MKMTWRKTFWVKTMMLIAVAALPLGVCVPAYAGEPVEGETMKALRVRFVGGDNEALVFNVKYNNKNGQSFRLLVLDETGTALFEDHYTSDLDGRIKVTRLTDSEHVVFLVKQASASSEISYTVKVTTKVVDDAVASRN